MHRYFCISHKPRDTTILAFVRVIYFLLTFLIYFQTQEETLFHKKVDPVTKPAVVKSDNSVRNSEEEAAEKSQISSPSTRDSDKV